MKFFRWFLEDHSILQPESGSSIVTEAPAHIHLSDQRRRRQDIPYLLPKDLAEGERLDLQHYLLRYAIKGLFMAPLDDNIEQILDVGSGTGIWGNEVAQQFPHARVFGLDLEPPQSLSLSTSVTSPPPNYHFVQGNVLQGLPFANQTFDFTHQRMLVLAVQTSNWSNVIRELIRVTRQGGWIELLEPAGTTYPAGPATERIMSLADQFLHQRGFNTHIIEQLGSFLQQEGLRQVEQHLIDIPIGSWDTHLGTLLEKNILATFTAVKAGVCAHTTVTSEEYDSLLVALPAEWKKYHSYHRFYLAYGQV